jgi:alginate O-acetyltransferase complex protein AlgI
VFADSLGPVVDDIFFAGPDSFGQAWLGAFLFAFQIYFDFSGYSDIAVGAAFLLGFQIPFNFRTPYLSVGPAEFWQRWHITLSTWIRDYLYISLGGSKGSRLRIIAVLILTMGLAGLWHGANYTFVVWGAAWGAYILVGRIMQVVPIRVMPLRWILHISVVTILWVFFRAPGIGEAFDYINVMFDVGSGIGSISSAMLIGLGVIGLFALHWLESRLATRSAIWKLRRFNTRFVGALLAGLILGLLLLPAESQNPFIYFRF